MVNRLLRVLIKGALVPWVFAGCCGAPIIQGWVIGSAAPKVDAPAEVVRYLHPEPGPRIRWFAKWPAFFFTPFKRLGFSGWNDTAWSARAEGCVVAAAWSTDSFVTIDLRLQRLKVDGQSIFLPPEPPLYLRAEVCGCMVDLPAKPKDLVGELLMVRGDLRWDRDGIGWYEIHPRANGDVAWASSGNHESPAPR